MNIDFKETKKTKLLFSQLSCGAIFTSGNETNFFIKIKDTEDGNAVNLGDGQIVCFGTEAETVLLNNKLTLWH